MNGNVFQNNLKWIYLAGIFIILTLPLWNLPPWFSPPDWGKTIVFKIVLSVLLFLLAYQILFQKQFYSYIKSKIPKPSFTSPFYLLLMLLGIFLLSTLFSQDAYFSFWGNPYRAGGFINFAFYILLSLLTFFLFSRNDWQRLWDFSILIAVLVSFKAIFQLYGKFASTLIPFTGRPPSTVGGPIFLAIYLLLLTFISFNFLIKDKNLIKKIFYLFSLILFLFTALFVTQTRAVFIGLFLGLVFFFLFFPIKNKKMIVLKTAGILIVISTIFSFYYVNTTAQLPQFVKDNKFLSEVIERSSIEKAMEDPRVSGWKVSWRAIFDKPILGYGPENFSIGFDKHYDPNLPKTDEQWGSWWDRAHNVFLETAISTGIPSLIVYLLLFIFLIYELQKLKKKNPENQLLYHCLQATFIAYLGANFFSFDTFSTYLISFLLISYTIYLYENNK